MPITTTPAGGSGMTTAQLASGTLPASFTTLAASGAVTLSGLATDLPSLASWVALFEANRLPVVADGTALSTWTDSSANGRDATQSGAARPVYKVAANGINSQPVVRFASASSQGMATATGGASLGSDFYVCAVVKFTTVATYQTVMCFGDDLTGKRRAMSLYSPSAKLGYNGSSADVTAGGVAAVAGTAYFCEITRSGGTLSVYVNGLQTSQGSPTFNAFASAVLHLGANNGATETLNGDAALYGFLGSLPTALLLSKIRGYVQATYGITCLYSGYNYLPSTTITSGLQAASSFFDNGTDTGVYGRRFVADEQPNAGLGHLFRNNDSGNGPVIFQNLNSAGYSAVDFFGHDVGGVYGVTAYGCAVGWGNTSASPLVFRNCGYVEVYDGNAGGTNRAFRIIQTNAGGVGNARRMEIEEPSGDFVWFDRSAAYPSEVEKMRLKLAGGLLSRPLVSAKATTPITVAVTDCGTVYTNEGATAQIVFNLPTAAANYAYTFIVQDADGIQVVASAGDTIRIAGSVSATAGNAASTTIGSTLTIVAINATEWIAKASNGTWVVT